MLHHYALFLTRCTRSLLSLQVGINDFYVRYFTVQLLTVLLQVRTQLCTSIMHTFYVLMLQVRTQLCTKYYAHVLCPEKS